ncbi:MAG: ribosome biogenesis GTPase Der [bacterium]
MKKNLVKVAIVGRANVGKSTLFNRLIEKNKALISSIPGTTRDRNIDDVKWRDRQFTLIDTGGLDIEKNDMGLIETGIINQTNIAIKDADLILFVIDGQQGVSPSDKIIADNLLRQGLKDKILLVANKIDSLRYQALDQGVFKLKLGEPQHVSAANGSGCGDLLDVIITRLNTKKSQRQEPILNSIKVAIIGKPNVGKSSLLNSILGEDRVIVSNIAHTTRESHDEAFEYNEHHFTLVDTAGIRKQNRIDTGSLEEKSVDKAIETVERCDVVLLVTEVDKSLELQDKKIMQAIIDNNKSVIIVANKWDLIPNKDTNTINEYIDYYRHIMPYIWWAPIIFTSAKENQRTKKILDLILDIKKAREIQITDHQLEHFMKHQIKKHKPIRGRHVKNPYIYRLLQEGNNPPRFAVYVNDPRLLHVSYLRYLQNSLREEYKIIGTPIQIEVRDWKGPQDRRTKKAKPIGLL